jgi:hypothetical protein
MTLYTFDIYLDISDIIDCVAHSVFSNVYLAHLTKIFQLFIALLLN